MQEKPRVGLILMRAEWKACGKADELRQQVEASTESIIGYLSKRFTIIGPWMVNSPESLAECQAQVSTDPPEMLLLAFQSWIDETLLVGLVKALQGAPLVLWCYLPFRRFPHPAAYQEVMRSSGSVTALSTLGTLRDLSVPFLFTWGAIEDPRLLRDLDVASRAAGLRKALQGARFGVLPVRRANLQSELASLERLREDLGPRTEMISAEDFCAAVEEISEAQVRQYLLHLSMNYRVKGVPEEVLERAARSALALASIAAERGLDVLALNGSASELSKPPRVFTALYPERGPQGEDVSRTIFLADDDLGAAVASYILHRLTGSPTMLMEFWYWDEALNQMVGGHGGPQNPAMAAKGQVWISREVDFCRGEDELGVQFELVAQPGRVTIFQLRATPGGWQAIAATGVALDSRPVVEGFAHVLLRLDVPVEAFLNHISDTGASQHWVMAYGSVMHEIEAFCQMENIQLLKLNG